MLTGTGAYGDPNQQTNTPAETHEQLRGGGMEAWERLHPVGENYGSWTKVIQKPNTLYVDLLAMLKQTTERTIIGEEARNNFLTC